MEAAGALVRKQDAVEVVELVLEDSRLEAAQPPLDCGAVEPFVPHVDRGGPLDASRIAGHREACLPPSDHLPRAALYGRVDRDPGLVVGVGTEQEHARRCAELRRRHAVVLTERAAKRGVEAWKVGPRYDAADRRGDATQHGMTREHERGACSPRGSHRLPR